MRVKTQFENLGDAVIVGELVQLLRESGDVVVSTSGVPASFVQSMRLNRSGPLGEVRRVGAVAFWSRLALSLLLGKRPRYVLMPGGIEGELTAGRLLKHRVVTWGLCLMRTLGARVLQCGVSYDRIGANHAKALRRRVEQVDLHLVRESGSLRYASTIGVRVDGSLPDLAFAIASAQSNDASRRGAIGVSFRVDKAASVLQLVRALAPKIAERSAGRDIYCVVQVKRDAEAMRVLAADLLASGCTRVTVIDVSNDLTRARETYLRCAEVYSNRLHVLLLGLASGAVPVPVLVPDSDSKVEYVWAEMELRDVVQYIDSWSGELPARAREARIHAMSMRQRLHDDWRAWVTRVDLS